MKKIYFLSMLFAALAFSGCSSDDDGNNDNNEPTLTVTPAVTGGSISFTAAALGETFGFVVTTNQSAWNLGITPASAAEWCKIETQANSFIVTALPNMSTTASADATITVTAGTADPVTITAKQAGHKTTDTFAGYITHDGKTKVIVRGAFYEEVGAGYRIHLSWDDGSDGREIFQTLEWLAIDIPMEMLGEEIDMETDDMSAYWETYINYMDGISYYDAFEGENTPGTLKITKGDNGYFTVELTNMELHDGTILSCIAKGVISKEYDHYFGRSSVMTGTSNFNAAGTDFPVANVIMTFYGDYYDDELMNTDIQLYADNADMSKRLSFSCETFHEEEFIASGTYTMVTGDRADKTFNPNQMNINNLEDGSTLIVNITGGTITITMLDDDNMKLTFNNITTNDPDGATITGTYTGAFHYRDETTRSLLSPAAEKDFLKGYDPQTLNMKYSGRNR